MKYYFSSHGSLNPIINPSLYYFNPIINTSLST